MESPAVSFGSCLCPGLGPHGWAGAHRQPRLQRSLHRPARCDSAGVRGKDEPGASVEERAGSRSAGRWL